MSGRRARPRIEVRPLKLDLGERSYPIRMGRGILAEVGAAVASRTRARRAALVTVPPVGRRYAATVARSLRGAGLKVHRFEVPDGDATKSLRQVARLYDAFLDAGLDRSSVVVALGGGMVGDLAGFAAATYLRGIPFVQVPTTVLAMVDASVGGKTGVNLPQGKNLVGAFHQPSLVFADVETLETLPARQLAAGTAEIVKAGAIWDEALFSRLERRPDAILGLEPRVLLPILRRACEIKAEVVAADEREQGVRRLLNFGHTLAHAVEALTGYKNVLHGEAVSIGMVHAARISEALGRAPSGTRERLQALLERLDLPVEAPRFEREAYLRALQVDKKKEGGRIHYVVLRRIGAAETVELTPARIWPG